MKVCVIGNSHVAALREALGDGKRRGGRDVDFYALPGGGQPIIAAKGDRLIPVAPQRPVVTDVEGAETEGLRFAAYDALALSACGLFAARNIFIERDPAIHPCGAFACPAWLEDAPEPAGGERIVSKSAFDAIVEAYIRSHGSIRLAQLLAREFKGQVLIQPWPAPSRALASDSGWFLNQRHGSRGPLAWKAFFTAQRRALANISRELGARFTLLDYPLPETLDDGFMEPRWCIHDPWHANATYGELVWDQIDAALAAIATP
ncbi:hypothetical protein K9U39_08005 [Rhodoblastus acidophilus]|uniref:SGNH/GDSL hydrolase family protein n=1 Tax=Candidatus Rhodoblastus alkanivorans TaxID=2954117 RepID=A0ABS9Z7G0_9HYPH|nr:hypothetical protein [Candidatus Rhodoblastus alkanivorans]MCI4678315.1 hypothetical protein [Candidatus Rhodoblastus alkanivorans]MCI4683573.1 hypothetical protein [Candidatus Rhodoblastus alkanivorans]MDI4640888.1 hypothetical protein [Rhodoblastus acidophilus]